MGKAIYLLRRKVALPFSNGISDGCLEGSNSPEGYKFTLHLVLVNTADSFPLWATPELLNAIPYLNLTDICTDNQTVSRPLLVF